MGKRILNIIAASVLCIAFFMPWFNFYVLSGSPFKMIKTVLNNLTYANDTPEMLLVFLNLIFPFCGLFIIIHYSQSAIKKRSLFILHILKKIPLIFILLVIIIIFIKTKSQLEFSLSFIKEFADIGLILTFISSIVLFFDQPKVKVFESSSENFKNDRLEEKENLDDLFN